MEAAHAGCGSSSTYIPESACCGCGIIMVVSSFIIILLLLLFWLVRIVPCLEVLIRTFPMIRLHSAQMGPHSSLSWPHSAWWGRILPGRAAFGTTFRAEGPLSARRGRIPPCGAAFRPPEPRRASREKKKIENYLKNYRGLIVQLIVLIFLLLPLLQKSSTFLVRLLPYKGLLSCKKVHNKFFYVSHPKTDKWISKQDIWFVLNFAGKFVYFFLQE